MYSGTSDRESISSRISNALANVVQRDVALVDNDHVNRSAVITLQDLCQASTGRAITERENVAPGRGIARDRKVHRHRRRRVGFASPDGPARRRAPETQQQKAADHAAEVRNRRRPGAVRRAETRHTIYLHR
jgi:hypothetical protein